MCKLIIANYNNYNYYNAFIIIKHIIFNNRYRLYEIIHNKLQLGKEKQQNCGNGS